MSFLSGNEHLSMLDTERIRQESTWKVRAVPNKYPALSLAGERVRRIEGLNRCMSGVGVHEVIIENTDHGREIYDLPLAHLQEVLETYKRRLISIENEFQYKYVHIFKNKGKEAGASLSHPHSQIVATPIIPKQVNEELYGCERLHRQFEECIFCRIIRDETRIGDRLVLRNDDFCVVTPYAPRFPFEMRIFPIRHSPWYSTLSKRESLSLAKTLKAVLSRQKQILNDPPFNYYIHQGPNPHLPHEAWVNLEKSYHWHMEIIPVLTRVAGFEWGTGFYINPVPPETAASFLRE
jgi:UDPglucose--hexose-1-phosphate uridylyltransferase